MGLIVGICGGSGSGKTTLCSRLADRLGTEAVRLSFDSYYRDLPDLPPELRQARNFDHPDSLDAPLLASHLDDLSAGHPIAVPGYDFTTFRRRDDLTLVEARPVVLVEGILLFCHRPLVERLDLRVFRHCPEEVRFARRRARDVVERGRSPESVRAQFQDTVKPMHDRFVEPYAGLADRSVGFDEDLDDVAAELERTIRALVPIAA